MTHTPFLFVSGDREKKLGNRFAANADALVNAALLPAASSASTARRSTFPI